MSRRAVAADTNLLRHPTPRRYITAVEALRGHRIAILPSVDTELRKHLPIQAAKHIEQLARKKGMEADLRLGAAQREAADAALEWWETERERNDSVYAYVGARDDRTYGRIAAELPDEAFTDDHDTDRWIYAEAMVHGVDVLASRNRETIIVEVLQEHFEARGGRPPVTVRSLWEHTTALANAERRASTAVAIETMLGAIVPEAWTGTDEDGLRLRDSAEQFAWNLRTRSRPKERPDPEREKLAHVLTRTIAKASLETLVGTANGVYATRPDSARRSEARYHAGLRGAVRATGFDLW